MSIFDVVTEWIHDLFGGTKSSDLADLGADPDQVVDQQAVQFPTMGGSPVMEQVNASMAAATEAYNEGMEELADAPKAPTAGEQAAAFVDGVMHASPEQLEAMGGTLGALEAGEEIRGSVAESHHEHLASKAEHAQRLAENETLIHAESVEKAAEAAAERAKDA